MDLLKNLSFISATIALACGLALYFTLDTFEVQEMFSIPAGIILSSVTYFLVKRNEI